MANIDWPKQGTASVLGTSPDRLDAIAKATGAAKYTYDIVPDNLLLARVLGSPLPHCKVKSIDVAPALKVPGVVAAEPLKNAGDEVLWEGDLLAVVAGETEGAVAEGLKAIKLDLEPLEFYVDDANLEAAEKADRTRPAGRNVRTPDDVDDEDEHFEKLFKECERDGVVVEAEYGTQVITHMCLEPHGSTCVWDGDKLIVYHSTQNVSGTAPQFASPLGVAASDVTVICDYIGGGFGSKFQADEWSVTAARLAKSTGRPVKLMLDRGRELKAAGNRPSGFIKVKIGADKNGVVKVWDSHHWGTNGPA